MKKSTYTLRNVLCITILMTGVFGCAEEFNGPETPTGETVTDVIYASTDFDILEAALLKTGLGASLDNLNSGSYTFFAPTDAAFLAYLQSSAVYNSAISEQQAILNIQNLTPTSTPLSIPQLAQRLNNHVVSSVISTDDITTRNAFTSLNASRLSLSKQTSVVINANISSVTAAGNGASITATNETPVNGIIHIIDRFLVPVATANVLTAIGYGATPISYATNPPTYSGGNTPDATDTDYDLFAIALRKTGLATVVFPNASPLPDYSLVIPRDLPFRTYLATYDAGVTNETTAQTFINSLTDGGSGVPATNPTLTEFTNLIKYHIIQGRVLSSDLSGGQQVTTLLTGKTFTVNVSGTTTITDQNGTSADATVVSSNNLTNAGLFHGIDNVLIPN